MLVMSVSSPPKKVYINELALILDRKVETIRKWETSGRLPKYLWPKRGKHDWRCWTPAQVEKIKEWMIRNDMRPGRLLTDPDLESQHVANLRKPKYISGHHIKSTKAFIEQGKSRDEIVKIIFPRTKYSTPEKAEKALVKTFKINGWDFPPKTNHRRRLSKGMEAEIGQLERQVNSLEKRNNGN